MKKLILISGLGIALSAPLSFACSEPEEKPEIPDPHSAATAQMVMANNQVREYVEEMQEYLGCARMSTGQRRRALSELEDYADEFNEAVRTFRSLNE